MAVAHDNTAFVSSGGTTSLTTGSFTISGSDRAAAIGLSHGTANSATNFSASVGGVSASLVSGTDSTTARTCRCMIFACAAPPTGSQTATASWTTSVDGTLGIETVTGANQTTPMNGGTFASAASGNASVSINSNSGDLTFNNLAVATGSASAPTQTSMWNDTTTWYGAGSRGAGAGSDTHGWTMSGGEWASAGANFQQQPVGVSAPRLHRRKTGRSRDGMDWSERNIKHWFRVPVPCH